MTYATALNIFLSVLARPYALLLLLLSPFIVPVFAVYDAREDIAEFYCDALRLLKTGGL